MTEDRRRLAPVLWIVVVAAYLFAAFWPFRLDLPRYYGENRISGGDDGSLRFVPPSTARSPGPPSWLPLAIDSGELVVDLEVRALEPRQSGPARILTVSRDSYRTNVTLGQAGADLVIRLRRPGTGPLGTPPFRVRDLLGDGRWHRVVLFLKGGRLLVVADGTTRGPWRLGPGALRSWNDGYRLALGDELSGKRGWHGEIRRAVVTVPGRTFDYLAPGRLVTPESWWYLPHKRPRSSPARPGDVVLNLVGFVPFGGLVAWRRRGASVVVAAASASLALSAAMELGQLVVPGRSPTIRDLVLNVTGGVVGALAVGRGVTGSRGSGTAPKGPGAPGARPPG